MSFTQERRRFMGTAIKNALAGMLPAHLSETPATEASVKGKQLLRGRTKATVDRLTGQVQDAQHAWENGKRAVGGLVSEGQDATEATQQMKRAHDLLDSLEAALVVAIQKDDAAKAALKNAEQQAQIEQEVEVVGGLKTAIEEWDHKVLDLERHTVDKVGLALNVAREVLSRSGIRDGELNFLTKLPLEAKRLLLFAVHPLTGQDFIPVNMRAYERLSQLIPDEEFVRSRARPGPSTATPIPGWQIGE
jgi:hypothetical protein